MQKPAYAKINWAIDIIEKRADGYHEIDMLMQSIELHDDIIFETGDKLTIETDADGIPLDDGNLVLRAAKALNEFASTGYGAKITLIKRVPACAGLGGGSGDCAAALIALNELWGLDIPLEKLMYIGASIGKDVPFCMATGAARVKGAGESSNS
ncbi:MAG: 4-(cytidine 5'-diphospho)-2-C-methyl-D-erythritol kinase [Clostridia bacterium]|nr:4-(cytidine 5'-diphospho)-2-C-methyl-D-erythritol kinase [Clostridia bacterium]